MKKLICLALSLLLLLCACTPRDSGADTTGPGENSAATTQTTPDETDPPPETTEATLPPDPLDDLRANLPLMDGSTSMIPLEAGIRAALFDKSIEDATLDVSHSSTWGSFWNLLHGDVDLIFSVPLSQEQWDSATAQGVSLETVPIAMEGFVFVVNAENPVDVLTQDQLRGIYSGEITNWSQVGGLDEEIIPYQRNNDSGSQNYMVEFMGDTPLMDAPTEMRPASMEGLMDVVAINDNARSAIGYSVYAYAADMYGNGNEIKFIQVDGVAPSKATMAAREYPLLGQNFAIFNANEPENGYVRQLVDWMVSYDGQLAIAQAGYVTLEDIGFDYEEMTLSKYQGTGTGPAVEGDPYEYSLYTLAPNGAVPSEYLRHTTQPLADGMQTCRFTGLANEALLEELHAFIDEQIETWAWAEALEVKELVQRLNEPFEYDLYSTALYGSLLQSVVEGMPLGISVTCTNGYLSAAVSVAYDHISTGTCYIRTETATWDLLTGERLNAEDLFCQNVDIDQVLNELILVTSQKSNNPLESWSAPHPTKRDYAGLTVTGWHLTHKGIYFDLANPYFAYGTYISLDELPEGTLVCRQARDFTDCVTGDNLQCTRQIRYLLDEKYYEYSDDGLVSCGYLPEDVYPHAKAINQTVRDYINTYYNEEHIRGYFDDLGYDGSQVALYWMDFHLSNWGGRYAVFDGPSVEHHVETEDRWVRYPYDFCLIFDLETGERLQWQDLLLPGWEENSTLEETLTDKVVTELSPKDMAFRSIAIPYDSTLLIHFMHDDVAYTLIVPFDYLDL